MLHRIRLGLAGKTDNFGRTKIGNREGGGDVEVDETFVGGKLQNMHKDRKLAYQIRGGGQKGKAVVMGMLDRDLREVRAKIVPNVKRETLQAEVMREVKHGSRVYTDEWVGYDNLHARFVHDVVNHMERYVDGQVHTNGIENFWSLLKRTLRGTYVAVEPYHLQRYVDEQVFRFNNRGGNGRKNRITDAERFRRSAVADRRQTAHLCRTHRQDGRNDAFLILIAGSGDGSRSLRLRTALRLSRVRGFLFRQHPVQVSFRYLEYRSHRIVESCVLR